MTYLEKFIFPDLEHDTLIHDERKGSFYEEHSYPFHLTSNMGLWSLDLEPITILYGGNGSGKSTIINVISQKLCADRQSMFNSIWGIKRSDLFVGRANDVKRFAVQ